jgi:hypothetical protein
MADKNKTAWSTAAANLIASHPHLTGLGVAAIAAALSHFYAGHSPMKVAALAAAGFIGGEALSRIIAHAENISQAAADAKATAQAFRDFGNSMPEMMAQAAEAAARLKRIEEEIAALRAAQAKATKAA